MEEVVLEEGVGQPGEGMVVQEEEWLQAQRMVLQQRTDHQEESESGWCPECPERKPHRLGAMGCSWVPVAKRKGGGLQRRVVQHQRRYQQWMLGWEEVQVRRRLRHCACWEQAAWP